MSLFAALVLALAQEDQVRRLIEQLSSDRIETRADAFQKLDKIGAPALDQLGKAAQDPDREVASRARLLVERISIREYLSPALESKIPGVSDRLAFGEWKDVFLELAADQRLGPAERRYPRVDREDLDRMAPMAASHAGSEGDRIALCQIFCRLRLKSAVPAVLPYLKDPSPLVRSNAVSVVRDTGARDQVAPLRECLADPSPLVRSVAAQALGKLGDREAVPTLRKLLGDPESNVRWWTVHALGELGAAEAIPDLERLADDPEETVRRVVRDTLRQLRQKP